MCALHLAASLATRVLSREMDYFFKKFASNRSPCSVKKLSG
jgi:hypothetical protein